LQTAKAYARELFEVLKLLKRTRDMSVNEVKLVVSIDDPRGKVCVGGAGTVRYG